MTGVQLLWLLLLLPAAAVEVWAIVAHRPATLSRVVWDAMRAWWFRVPLFALFGWVGWHWFVEHFWLRGFRGDWVSDVFVALAFALLGLLAVPVADELKSNDDTEPA